MTFEKNLKKSQTFKSNVFMFITESELNGDVVR